MNRAVARAPRAPGLAISILVLALASAARRLLRAPLNTLLSLLVIGIALTLPGVGMIASKLQLEVVPIRLHGVNRVLRPGWKFPRPGRVKVVIGKPLRLEGDDYLALARKAEQQIKEL